MFNLLCRGRRRGRQTADTITNYQPDIPDREEDGFVLVGESAIERSTVSLSDHNYTPYTDCPPSYESQVSDDATTFASLRNLPCDIANLEHIPCFASPIMGQRSSNQVMTSVCPEYVTDGGVEIATEIMVQEPMPISINNPISTPSRKQRPYERCSIVSTLPGEVLSEEDLRFGSAHRSSMATCESAVDGIPFRLAVWLEFVNSDLSVYECLTLPNINLEDFNYDFSVEKRTVREYQQRTLLDVRCE